MSAKERLAYAIIKFLASEAETQTSEDKRESIEVARQCLETAYGLEYNTRADLELPAGLEEIVEGIPPIRVLKEATPEEKAEAERLKNEGNEFMKGEQYQEAVSSYSKAIDTDPTNAIYFSNRAAAYNKLERYYEAVDDCDEAIAIDQQYSKAYGRKGLALSGLNQHTEAIKCYKRAIELDPNNQNFKTNLEIAEEKARTTSAPTAGLPGGFGSLLGGGAGGMPDLGAILNNPNMMQMAAQMMQNPAMQQMMGNMMTGMQGGGGGGGPPEADPSTGAPPAGMDNLLNVGQQLAAQLQQSNPELVNQLRNQFQGSNMGDGNDQPPNGDGSQQ